VHEALDLPTLVAYISYAKKHIHPELSDEAAEELTRRYVQMRQRGNTPGSRKKVLMISFSVKFMYRHHAKSNTSSVCK
jgi:DNA replicative helicase MCM subunit Mcm2 (Cdc46/Mcm family)